MVGSVENETKHTHVQDGNLRAFTFYRSYSVQEQPSSLTSDTAVLCHGSEPLLNHFSLFLPTLYYYNPLTGIGSCVLTFCLFVGS